MKRRIGLVIVFILIVDYSFGQTSKKDSIEAYQKIRRWAITNLTIAYIEDLRNYPNKNNEENDSLNNNDEFKAYQILKNNYADYSENIDLEDVEEILMQDGSWEKAKESVFDKYRVYFKEDFDPIKFHKIPLIPEGEKKVEYRKKVVNLIHEQYDKLLKHINSEERQSSKAEKSSLIAMVNDENSDSSARTTRKNPSWVDWIWKFVLPTSILLNLLFLFFYEPKRKNHKIPKVDGSSSISKISNEEIKKQEKINELNNRIRNLENRKISLENEIDILNKDKNNFNTQFDTTRTEGISNINNPTVDLSPMITSENYDKIVTDSRIENIKDNKNILYFPSPFGENLFKNIDASEVKTKKSYYKVEYKVDLNEGIITIIDDVDLGRQLNSPETYFRPVCEYMNLFSFEAKRVIVEAPGEIKKEDDDWVVTKKIKIRFI